MGIFEVKLYLLDENNSILHFVAVINLYLFPIKAFILLYIAVYQN